MKSTFKPEDDAHFNGSGRDTAVRLPVVDVLGLSSTVAREFGDRAIDVRDCI